MIMGVPGVETGTTAIQLTGGSIVRTTPLSGNVDQTLLVYASVSPTWPSAITPLLWNGDSATTTRGTGCKYSNPAASPIPWALTQNATIFRQGATVQPNWFWNSIGL